MPKIGKAQSPTYKRTPHSDVFYGFNSGEGGKSLDKNNIDIRQWALSPIYLKFDAKAANPDARLKFNVVLKWWDIHEPSEIGHYIHADEETRKSLTINEGIYTHVYLLTNTRFSILDVTNLYNIFEKGVEEDLNNSTDGLKL